MGGNKFVRAKRFYKGVEGTYKIGKGYLFRSVITTYIKKFAYHVVKVKKTLSRFLLATKTAA